MNPYQDLPPQQFWRTQISTPGLSEIDYDAGRKFTFDISADRFATAGSCFSQHFGRELARRGGRLVTTETRHPLVRPVPNDGYDLFSARYGNIYTTLQLEQLIDRAYGRFAPVEDIWVGSDGKSVVDPFRPTIQPGGFASEAEMRADRAQHLGHVREALETLDLMVFTLGLTEGWRSKIDGAAFPLCPGVAGGVFDPALHEFHNARTGEVRSQIGAFVERLRAINPRARLILTVSPVPLAASASGNHVLPATIYSKSALRAAAQEAAEDLEDVFYFPSYEIVTGPQARGRFFAEDLREVTEEGVEHVMRVFLRHAAGLEAPAPGLTAAESDEGFTESVANWVETMCDEAMLDGEDA